MHEDASLPPSVSLPLCLSQSPSDLSGNWTRTYPAPLMRRSAYDYTDALRLALE